MEHQEKTTATLLPCSRASAQLTHFE